MKKLWTVLTVLATLGALAATPGNGSGEPTTYAPPFAVGPSGGDRYNLVEADEDGRIVLGRAYPVPSFLSCGARGGYVLYELTHPADHPFPEVSVDFSDAVVDPYVFVTINVIDTDGDFLGAYHERGPMTGAGQFTVAVGWPDAAQFQPRDIRIQFGLELTSACPSADAGTIKFDAVTLGH